MAETLRPYALEITAFEGRVLVEAPGLAATLAVETALELSDKLIAACSLARQQRHAAIEVPSAQ